MSDRAAALAAARASLEASADGELARGRRHAVLRALGDGGEGRGRRARLAREAAEQVLPLWRAERPGDRDPEQALALIDGVLEGSVDEATARRVAGRLWAHVDNLLLTAGLPAPLMVGHVASRALLSALLDEPLDPPDGDPAQTDDDTDPRRLDTAYLAAVAAAGGAPWEPDSDVERRRAFWRWWLDRAAAA
jgi:Immunity protein Imm5